jgi:hypothetical protein
MPLSRSKQRLPVCHQPMIYYPLSTMPLQQTPARLAVDRTGDVSLPFSGPISMLGRSDLRTHDDGAELGKFLKIVNSAAQFLHDAAVTKSLG